MRDRSAARIIVGAECIGSPIVYHLRSQAKASFWTRTTSGARQCSFAFVRVQYTFQVTCKGTIDSGFVTR